MVQLSKEQILDGVLSRNFGEIELSECYEAMDIHSKQTAIAFFKWYVFKMTGFLEYLKDVKPLVTSNEIEENLKAFEGKLFNELYELFLQSLSSN